MALPNGEPGRRSGRVISGGWEVEVVQLGNGPGEADGTYRGLTDQGFPVEVVIDRGDLTAFRFVWTAAPSGTCPVTGSVDARIEGGSPLLPGRAFGPFVSTSTEGASIAGTAQADGTLAGSVSVFRCQVGHIPLFAGGRFTARRGAAAAATLRVPAP